MKFIIGKKLEMTQVWKDGKLKPVTKIQAGPCVVTQMKSEKTDGYNSAQLGFGNNRKEKNIKKPQLGHLKKVKDLGKKINFEALREFRLAGDEKMNIGDVVRVDTFDVGDKVGVTGISKGKGFAGVVKRHGFKGSKKTHGNKDQLRMPGSIGATGPAHVFKGTRMGGRMGTDKVTTTNMEIIDVDMENNIILIKGAVPGARNGLVLLKAKGELKVVKEENKEKVDTKENTLANSVQEKTEEIKAKEVKVEELKTEELKKEETKEEKK